MRSFAERFPRYDVLGTHVHAVSIDDVLGLVAEAVRTRTRLVVAHQNSHGAYIARNDRQFRNYIERADVVYPDGMSMIVAARIAGLPFDRKQRATSVDFVWPMMEQAQREQQRIFFVGARSGIAAAGAALLRESYPDLLIDTHHGYFDKRPDSVENSDVLERIRIFDTDVLIVGFGMPLQEHWIADNEDAILAPVVFPIGALMDYLAGAIPTPPRWMGRWGLEWLYRLWSEPSRLWHRYAVEPWYLLLPLARDIVRNRIRRSGGSKR